MSASSLALRPQTERNNMEEYNIFIDFEIIRQSNQSSLYKELDLLIIAGKRIHVWSSKVSPEELEKYCSNLVITPDEYNKDTHIQVRELRLKEKKTYKEIADTLKIDVKLIGFYVKTDPEKSWKLSDWIVDYHTKDSSIYEKVDYLVDCDIKLVERFKRAGRKATFIEKV